MSTSIKKCVISASLLLAAGFIAQSALATNVTESRDTVTSYAHPAGLRVFFGFGPGYYGGPYWGGPFYPHYYYYPYRYNYYYGYPRYHYYRYTMDVVIEFAERAEITIASAATGVDNSEAPAKSGSF